MFGPKSIEKALANMDETLPPPGPAYWALQALQYIPYHVFAEDLAGRILFANQAMATSCGHSGPAALVGKTVFDLFPAETAAAMRGMERQVIETARAALDHEHEFVEAIHGRRRWVKTSRTPLYDDAGAIVGLACTATDVTEARQADDLLLAQAKLLDMIAQSAPIAEIFNEIVAVVENYLPAMMGAIQLRSPDGNRLMTPTAPSVPDEVLATLQHGAGNALVQAMLSSVETGHALIVGDVKADARFDAIDTLSAFGIRAVWCMPIFSLEGNAIGALSFFSGAVSTPTDVQSDVIAMASHMVSSAVERQEIEARNKFLASHDSLTGLPNRMMFETILAQTLERSAQSQLQVGLAFFDMDNFKSINDSLGHAAGDALLKMVAERATGAVRAGDLVARLGGDEFVMLLVNLSKQSEVNATRFQRIRESISAPVVLNGRNLRVTCSMGVAYFPSHAKNSLSLISHADMAMYRAKQLGRDNIQFFEQGLSAIADERLSLLTSLRDAVARREFVLHYQPQIDLDSGRIFAAESLVRWNHPELGLLYPGDFIALAEETGLIIALGDWVLNEGCRQNKAWQDAGLPPMVVSVNVSARQFRDTDLVARVAAALESSGLDSKYLELELTESLVMQEGALSTMQKLNELGVTLAIDDFGTGYSSLGALKRFPVSRLKIDRAFVQDISDERDQAIACAIIEMAKKLRMKVVAEGVETSRQLETLRDLGCKEIQGYYFSRPVAPDRFFHLLRRDEDLSSNLASQGSDTHASNKVAC